MLRQDLYNDVLGVLVNYNTFENNIVLYISSEDRVLLSNILSYNFYTESIDVPEDYTRDVLERIENLTVVSDESTLQKVQDIFPETSWTFINLHDGYWLTSTGVFTSHFMNRLSEYLWIGALATRDYETLDYLVHHSLYNMSVIYPRDILEAYGQFYISAPDSEEKELLVKNVRELDTIIDPIMAGDMLLETLQEDATIYYDGSEWIILEDVEDRDRLQMYLDRLTGDSIYGTQRL